jgi:hypothetical protein
VNQDSKETTENTTDDQMTNSTSGSGGRANNNFHRKSIIKYAVIVLILLVLLVAGFALVGSHSKTNNSTTKKAKAAQAYTSSFGNPSVTMYGNQAKLDADLRAATTPDAKSYIYLKKVAVGSATMEPSATILGYAKQAEALNPTSDTALTIANLSENSGDLKSAITYYNSYLTRTAAIGQSNSANYQHYAQYVKELEAKP